MQLTGFWASKYKLREGATEFPDISGGSGVIRINNIAEATNPSYICEMYLIKDGKRIELDENTLTYQEGITPVTLTGNYKYTKVEPGTYSVNIIIKNATTNIQEKAITKQIEVAKAVEPNAPDLTGFNQNNTFYVTYDGEGNEQSYIPIGENAPANWYDYIDQKWANIVVRENGNESYYTWIPRYEYKLDTGIQKTNALFIPADKIDADEGYTIPDAFTWEYEENGVTKQKALSGFWASKYKLREGDTYTPDIYGLGGKVEIKNVVSTIGTSYTYDAYIIQNGKLVKDNAGNIIHKQFSGDTKITKLDAGEYTVCVIAKDSTGKYIRGVTRNVTVGEKEPINEPDKSNLNNNVTFYVTYDDQGNETSNIPLGLAEPTDWYDYDDDKKATIVIRENGIETYYEWIPRYQCLITDNTRVAYIPNSKITPDEGYIIPDVFSGDNESGYWNKIETKENRIKANVASSENEIKITNIELPAGTSECYISLIKAGKIEKAQTKLTSTSYTYSGLTKDTYAVNIVAYNSSGVMIGSYTEEEMLFKVEVDLTGYNPNNTFYVTYDAQGNETSAVPIGETAPESWYDYTNQKWANIVVRDNGNTSYYTWIPRYEYKVNNGIQRTNVRFIPADKLDADEGYTIPDAFTWEYEENGETKQKALSGFWASKYKLREGTTEVVDISGGSGAISINGITEATDTNYICEMYLIKDGKRIGNAITLTGSYKYTGLDEGVYAVNIIIKNAATNVQEKAITRQVEVTKETKANAPDLTGFNESNTFYVTYDDQGNEISNTPISELAPTGWYDYTNQKWANIVVRDNNGNVNYFTWIPRYEYKLDTGIQKTNVIFIPETKQVADEGYTIPDAFTWEYEENGVTKQKALSGFWAGKYKLREGNTASTVAMLSDTANEGNKATKVIKQLSKASRELDNSINELVSNI